MRPWARRVGFLLARCFSGFAHLHFAETLVGLIRAQIVSVLTSSNIECACGDRGMEAEQELSRNNQGQTAIAKERT